jgi:hypothetical protein
MRLTGLVVLALIAGCSSQAVTPSETRLAASNTDSKVVPAVPVAAGEEAAEFTPPPGYKRRVENGEVVYCTKLVVLGSRFPKEDCRTQQQLEELELRKAEQRGNFEQNRQVCTSAAGCANN